MPTTSRSTNLPIMYHHASAHSELYVQTLQAAYDAGIRLHDPDFAMQKDAAIAEKIQRDPVVKHAIEHRLRKVAPRAWRIDAASDRDEDMKLAAIMEDLLSEIERVGGFRMSRYELAQGVILARTFAKIRGRRIMRDLQETGPKEWWHPTHLRDLDRRRTRWVPTREGGTSDTGRIQTHLEMYDLNVRQWVKVDRPELFVKVTFENEEGRLGYGRGLIEAIYFYHFAKGVVLKEGLQGVERWAQGMALAKIDTTKRGSGSQSTAQIVSAFLDAIKTMRGGHAMAVDKDEDVDWKSPTGQGHRMVVEILEYLDRAITQVITGAVLPTGGGADVGSNARAEEESDSTESVVQFDRGVIDDSITRDLLGFTYRVNFPIIQELGLGDALPPRFATTNEKQESPTEAAESATTLLGGGVPLVAKEVYERTGWTQPKPGDDVIEPMVPAAAPGFGLPGEDGEDGQVREGDEGEDGDRSRMSAAGSRIRRY